MKENKRQITIIILLILIIIFFITLTIPSKYINSGYDNSPLVILISGKVIDANMHGKVLGQEFDFDISTGEKIDTRDYLILFPIAIFLLSMVFLIIIIALKLINKKGNIKQNGQKKES